jgi:hypothetical protein
MSRYEGGMIGSVANVPSGTAYTGRADGMFILPQQIAEKSSSLWAIGQTKPNVPTIGTATGSGPTTISVAFTPAVLYGGFSDTVYTATLANIVGVNVDIAFNSGATGGGTVLYTATSTPGSISATSASSPITVTGLPTGQTYTFTVHATNSFGYTSIESTASSSVFVYPTLVPINYLIVAGGGAGGQWAGGGGGGAGGVVTGSTNLSTGTYTITVGAGGTYTPSSQSQSTSGSNSLFNGISATGGGRGGWGVDGASGGSGGGGGGGSSNGSFVGGIAVSGQGFAGGYGGVTNTGGGGGGAGSVGTNASTAIPGNGGNGTPSNITGTTTYYAGGGGGGRHMNAGSGGTGGTGGGGAGGNYGSNTDKNGVYGTVNTGGGGGGAGGITGQIGADAGAGGSGIVIISYLSTYPAAISTTGSPTVSISGNYRIYKFTGSGSITF